MSDATRLRQVLAGQRFPAQTWELVAGAEFYGADALTRRDLRALPARRFRDLGEVLSAIAGSRTGSVA